MARERASRKGRTEEIRQAPPPGSDSPTRVSGPDAGQVEALPADLRPRRRPRQERSRETVTAILQAAAELFANRGYGKTTTNRIAERAGVSVGSLYQYFPNKDAILAGLAEQHLEDVRRTVHDALEDLADEAQPLDEAIRSLLLRLVALHEADPEVTRALSQEVPHLPLLVHSHKEGEARFAGEVERILASRPDVRRGDTRLMARVTIQATEALTRWLVHVAPAEELGEEARDDYLEEIVRLLAGYLGE